MSFPEPDEFVTGAMSDIGQVREVNQDYCGEFDDPNTGRRSGKLKPRCTIGSLKMRQLGHDPRSA